MNNRITCTFHFPSRSTQAKAYYIKEGNGNFQCPISSLFTCSLNDIPNWDWIQNFLCNTNYICQEEINKTVMGKVKSSSVEELGSKNNCLPVSGQGKSLSVPGNDFSHVFFFICNQLIQQFAVESIGSKYKNYKIAHIRSWFLKFEIKSHAGKIKAVIFTTIPLAILN